MEQKSKSFQDIKAWQESHKFVLMTYQATAKFPKEELFCLTSQFRRAAISIAANIAEGYKKRGKNDKLRFFNISQGSLEECRYYLILALDLHYMDANLQGEMLQQLEHASRLLNAYYSVIDSDR